MLALLAAAIWFGGPLIAWDDYTPLAQADKRLYVILALFLVWLLKLLLLDLDASNPFQYKDSQTRKKLQPLQNQFHGAMQFLKKTFITKHHTQVSLNQLPWYLLIGPHNAGKTSLLANSNANFILQRQFQNQNTKNLEASENCNWWVTRDASIIDVPGKYLLNESTTPQPLLWRFLLRLIKKQRGKNAIQGIVIAFSFPEIIAQSDTKKYQALTRTLLQRLSELQKLFQKPIPCYLLITKCDLLPGFTEYFSELGNDETSQAWGVMLPEPENGETITDLFTQRFNALIKRLNQQLIWRLHQERNPMMRPAIKDFPLQVERLKEFAHDFIKKISSSPFAFSLQGVYLTSALQTPKEPPVHLLDDYSQASHRAIQIFKEPVLLTRAYFIKQFITHGLTSGQPVFSALTKKQIWVRRTAYAVSLGMVSLTAMLLGRDFEVGVEKAYSIQNNLTEYRLAIRAFHNPEEHLIKTIALLDTLQKAVKHVGFKLDLAHLLSFYSYKSQEKVGLVYEEALKSILLPEIKKYLEEYLKIPVNKNVDSIYSALKAYLMLGEPTHLETETFLNTVQLVLPKSFRHPDEQHLLVHLSAALNLMSTPLALNTELIQKTRDFLTSTPNLQLGYVLLKNTNNNDTASNMDFGINTTENTAFSIQPALNQLPTMFTAKTLSNILSQEIVSAAEEAIKGNWILGINPNADQSQIAPLIEQLRSVYIINYIDTWEDLVDNIHLNSAQNLAQTDAIILNLISNKSPLLQLLETLRNNTYFEPITTASPKLESLGLLVDKNNQSANLLFQIFSGLRLMHQYLQPIINAKDQRKAAFEALAYRINHNDKPDAITQLRILAERSPAPIKTWLNQLTNEAWHLLMHDAGNYINTAWENQVMRFYRSEITNRYPFNSNSPDEVELEKFTMFFGNPGILSNFYQAMLQPFVDTSKPDWQWKSAIGKLPFSEETLHQIQQAIRIQRVFYPNGDNKLYVQFSIEPYQMGKQVKRVQLSINDKKIVDEHAHVRSPHVLTWPNSSKLKMTTVRFTLQNREIINQQYPGEWGWFKLVNQAFENAVTKKQTLLNLSTKNVPVKYYLYTEGQLNPFLSLNLKQFKLPEKL